MDCLVTSNLALTCEKICNALDNLTSVMIIIPNVQISQYVQYNKLLLEQQVITIF